MEMDLKDSDIDDSSSEISFQDSLGKKLLKFSFNFFQPHSQAQF